MSAEATVVCNYIDWLVKVPWKKRTKIIKDIARAEKVLDEGHFGAESFFGGLICRWLLRYLCPLAIVVVFVATSI